MHCEIKKIHFQPISGTAKKNIRKIWFVWVLTQISWWSCHSWCCHIFVIILSHGLSWCSLVCHEVSHDVSHLLSHTCHYIVTSHDLLWCYHIAWHNVVTWPVTMLSLVCHNVVTGLSQCCHMTCHDVITWPVTMLSLVCHTVVPWPVTMLSCDLSWCCHLVCHDVTYLPLYCNIT